MPDTLAVTLSRFAAATRMSGLEGVLVRDVMERVLDTTGNALAAVGEEPADIALDLVGDMGGVPESTIIGSGLRVPAASAALVNGTLAHALDFDDTHLPSVLHPSSSVVPTALAVSQAVGASGPDTLVAIAVANEITVRLGMASYDRDIRNSIFFENGLHATSIIGTLGSAVAAAMLYGLDQEQVRNALAISASMGAGLLEANRTGGSVKRIHCGWAAHSGVIAAQFARRGLTGPPTVLEGRFGFFRAYSEGRFDEDAILGGLGVEWELPKIFYKPYPTNHFTHAGIDAALAVRARGISSTDIVAIELGVPEPVLRTIAEPADRVLSRHTTRSFPDHSRWRLRSSGEEGSVCTPTTSRQTRFPILKDSDWLQWSNASLIGDPRRSSLTSSQRCSLSPSRTVPRSSSALTRTAVARTGPFRAVSLRSSSGSTLPEPSMTIRSVTSRRRYSHSTPNLPSRE